MKLDNADPVVDELKFFLLEALHRPTATPVEKVVAGVLRKRFGLLPRYQQVSIMAYKQGVQDTLARAAGKPVSVRPINQETVPPHVERLQPGARWHRHPNGGGWVSETAQVQETAYVARGCVVYDYAIVVDQARMTGFSKAHNWATIKDRATLGGHAVIGGRAIICDDATVNGSAAIETDVKIGGHLVVSGSAKYQMPTLPHPHHWDDEGQQPTPEQTLEAE